MFLPPSASARPVVRPGTAVGESENWADQRQVMGAIKNGWDDFFSPLYLHTYTQVHAHTHIYGGQRAGHWRGLDIRGMGQQETE